MPSTDVPSTEKFRGRIFDEVVERELVEALHPTQVRTYRVGEPLTRELVWERLEVGLDDEGRIVSHWFDVGPWERQSGH